MLYVENHIRALGGVAATHELLARGVDPEIIKIALRYGRPKFVRARQGWYVLTELGEEVIGAVRVGGVLTCASAAARLGLIEPQLDGRIHVRIDAGSARLRTSFDSHSRLAEVGDPWVVAHWTRERRTGDRVCVSAAEAMAQMGRCGG